MSADTDCGPETRSKLRAAADHIGADPTVAAVDIIDPADDPTGRWTLEITIGPETAMRPTLLQTIAAHGLELDWCQPTAAHSHRRAVVRLE